MYILLALSRIFILVVVQVRLNAASEEQEADE
jgi:hypothetical protein